MYWKNVQASDHVLPRPLSFRAIGGRGSGLARNVGEMSPSDCGVGGAGMNKPAAALKGYATAATTAFFGDSSERYRSEATYGDSSADT